MRRTSRNLPLVLTLLAIHLASVAITMAAAAASPPAVPAAAIDAFLSRTYPANGPGAAVIVVKDGKTILRKGYGMADLELGVPVDPGMVFRIGSVTKQFTSAAIMVLVEKGAVALDDDVTKFLPDYPTGGKRISIERLLTHTSGVKSYTGMPSFMANMRKDYTVAEMIEVFRSEPMDFEPGAKWNYSNSGYFLLGAIIEKAGGMPYGEFLKQNIFEPLGLVHTAYGSEGPIIPKRVLGYDKGPEGWVNSAYVSMTQPYAAGALVSSVDDLARWDAALAAGKLLSKESLARVWTPSKLANGESTGYGYGWMISQFQGHQVIGHGGGINGFSCHVLRMPADGLYVALLTNFIGGEIAPEYAATRVAATALGIPGVDPVAIKVDPGILDTYVGVYKIDDRRTRTIRREGDQLYSQKTGGPMFEIYPLSENEFFFKNSFARLTFGKDEKGGVARAEMKQGGVTEVAIRATGEQTAQAGAAAGAPEAAPAPTTPAPPLVDPRLFDAYAGKYELAPGFVITITSENGHLMAQATGQGKFEVYPESETKFYYKVVDARITFTRDKDGIVSQLTLHQNGRDMPARRLR